MFNKYKMVGGVKMLAAILKFFGKLGANAGTSACIVWCVDEPECPKSLLK